MKLVYSICLLSLALPFEKAASQTTPFFARPAETFEGDAVVFTYRADKPGAIPLEHIQSWKWDFDGIGAIPHDGSDSGTDHQHGT